MFSHDAPNPYPQTSSLPSWLRWLSSSNQSTPSSTSVSGSESIGKFILPAQTLVPSEIDFMQLYALAAQYDLNIEHGDVNTHDKAVLKTMQITPKRQLEQPENERRYVVKFVGNMTQYEQMLNTFISEAANLNATIVGFNFRGVGNSTKTPHTFQELVTDGIAEIDRLLKNGVNPENITIDGISLGAAIATMVAAYFHQHGKCVYLFNDRSLSRISAAAAGMLAPTFRWPFGDIAFSSTETTTWGVLKATGWQENLADAYNSIPAQYKTHMYVAKASEESIGDGVIAHPASLHVGVKRHEKEKGINTGHKVYARFYAGHNQSRHDLDCKESEAKNGQEVYENFVLRKKL